ncbi:hypothetical protein ACG02S_17210 [Roseateles sp. DC23W]|uniref:Uncharacterized protein n=1 Tax=Pelomonas dachongensis TaxID=3299029 RepID=A0ABW7EQ78_9BURK
MSNPPSRTTSQAQQQGSQDATQAQHQAPQAGQPENPPSDAGTWNPPATRLPQHPQQQQEDPAQRPGEQQRIRQQGETSAEDTSLPAPTEVD